MITIEDQFVVGRPLHEVWAFFDDFAGLAGCVPTLQQFAIVRENLIEGKVGVTLGAIPITSKVRLEIRERRQPHCIQAFGISYLGETIATQLTKPGEKEKYAHGDAGQLYLHLDLLEEELSSTRVMMCAGVEAEGRLRKIYESIIRLKVPAMKAEFRDRVSRALDASCAPVGAGRTMCQPIDVVRTRIVDGPPAEPAASPPPAAVEAHAAHMPAPDAAPPAATVVIPPPRLSWWSRLASWLSHRFAGR